ncbi:MAG: hypothetical protein EP344_04775 [Bacteroidetes bacterium]|nr:MAG: hypothetical protein EP344_04775 [Bacteroidota bacterium]
MSHRLTLYVKTMLNHTSVLILAFILALALPAGAQQGIPERIGSNINRGPSIQALEKKAQRSYDAGNYYASMQYYRRILEVDSLQVAARLGLAAAALAHTNYEEALMADSFLVKHKLAPEDAGLLMRLANIQYHRKQYADAKELYQRAANTDTTAQGRAEATARMEDCDWAMQVQKDRLDLVLDSLRDYVNTRYSEYSNVWNAGRLYYSSYSKPLKGDSSRLLIQSMLGKPRPDGTLEVYPAEFNEEKQHTAYVTFNADKSIMYYAIGKYARNKPIRFDLYRRKREGESSWGKPEKLPRIINARGYTTTQPHICRLPGDDAETLFFVSNRPNGKGKKDIWYSRIVNDTFSAPVNLAFLNTEGDDVTPFFFPGTGSLYFSSNGRKGIGGFDIYRSDYIDQKWTTPEHMPVPLNSNANDVFFSLSEHGDLTFFSSNRKGALNFSEEECCYDIFTNENFPALTITTCNEETNDSLVGVDMTLLEISANGTRILDTVQQVPGATYRFPVLPGRSYMVIVSKIGFNSDTVLVDTPQKMWDKELAKRLCLRPAHVDLWLTVVDADSARLMTGATVILEDEKWYRPDGGVEMGPEDQPLNIVSHDHPDSSSYWYNLMFQHTYMAKASKEGYTTDSVAISTVGLLGDTTIYDTLYINRGLKLHAYVFDDINRRPLDSVTIRLVEVRTGKRWVHQTGKDENDYHTIIYYDTRYRLVATKPGYSTDSLDFETDVQYKRAFHEITKELFLRPLNLEAYLPIALYFDNDEPGPHRIGVTSIKKEYIDTYLPYYNRKERFVDEYSKGLTGDTLKTAQFEMDTFFENRVRGEWNRMRMFSEVLYNMLENGDRVRIEIRGYASPLASAAYNRDLTSRRVSTIMNHFEIFDGGIFKPYIDSGQLVLIRVPNGDSKAPKYVNDDPKNRRLSVYSVDASKERRVEVVGVDVDGNIIPIRVPQK